MLARIPARNAEVVAYIESDVSVVAGPLTLVHGCGEKASVTVASRKAAPGDLLRSVLSAADVLTLLDRCV